MMFINALRRAADPQQQRVDDSYDYVRSRGIIIVVETLTPRDSNEVAGLIRESWRWGDVNIELIVRPLFQAPENSDDLPPVLRKFYLANIPTVHPSDLEFNLYDACYALLGDVFRSAEPDLPYNATGNLDHGTAPVIDDKAWALRNMHAPEAWGLMRPSRPGKGVKVAHLDTGWTVHDDLDQDNFVWDDVRDFIGAGQPSAMDPMGLFQSAGHGTRTGSIIMSRGDVCPNPPGGTTGPGEITGVAPYASYVPIRCVERVAVVYASDIAKAVEHARQRRCDVISMSLGGLPLKALRKALDEAVKYDMIVVAAAGNRVGCVVYPARYEACIAVAASTAANEPWTGSSRGAKVDVAAPGHQVWVAEPTNAPSGTRMGSGTSYATAHVAGVAALWATFCPSTRNARQHVFRNGPRRQQIFRNLLRDTARRPPGWQVDRFGRGIVDALGLLVDARSRSPAARFTRWDGYPSLDVERCDPVAEIVHWIRVGRDADLAQRVRDLLISEGDGMDDLGPYGHELICAYLRAADQEQPFEESWIDTLSDELRSKLRNGDAA